MHSHTTKAGDTFNFNPDMSGRVQIINGAGDRLWVDGQSLVEFVDVILENMTEDGPTIRSIIAAAIEYEQERHDCQNK